jgi:hypothetical protein
MSYEEWIASCAEYLCEHRPDLPIYDVDSASLKTAFALNAAPDQVLGSASVQLATSRDLALLPYFLGHISSALAGYRPDIQLSDLEPSALQKAYLSGSSVEVLIEQDLPLKIRPLAARPVDVPVPTKAKIQWWHAVPVVVAVCLVLFFILRSSSSSSSSASEQSLEAAAGTSSTPAAQDSGQPDSPDSQPAVSSAQTNPGSDSEAPAAPAMSALTPSGTVPQILSASCSASVKDGQGYLDLDWSASEATQGEVIVNGATHGIDPAMGHESVAASFGHATVKFVFANSNGAASKVLYQNVVQAAEKDRQEPSSGSSLTPPDTEQSGERPVILGFSVTLDSGGGEARWNVTNADKIQLSVDGKVYVDVPNQAGTANLIGLSKDSVVTLTAFNGNQRAQKSAAAKGVYQYGSVGE